jgi:hypothetical protein
MTKTPERYQYPSPSFAPYWDCGRGAKLLSKIQSIPQKEEMDQRIPDYFKVDELADKAVAETFLVLGFEKAMELYQTAFTDTFPHESFPASSALIQTMEQTPAWLDRTLLEFGSMLCQRSGSLGLMILRNYSLMGGYESAAINKPLIYTGALKKGAAKRLRETTEFWLQIVGPDAFEKKIILRYALQTRLIHAYSRYSILTRTDWNSDHWGVPLNEWDMIATNLGFSLVYLDGLRAMGFDPTPQEVTGLFHFWKYLGYLIGITPEKLPVTEEEAIRALYLWTMNQPPADTDTIALAQALMEEPNQSPFPRYTWQKKLVRWIHLGYNAHFLGETSCKNLGLPYSSARFFIRSQRNRNARKEFQTLRSSIYYMRSVDRNRKTQEKIVKLFFKFKASK